MTEEEYGAIADELQARGPCSLLVFGLGKDSSLWIDVNKSGRTVFLEHDWRWVERARKESADIDALVVEYHTRLADIEHLKIKPMIDLAMKLPGCVRTLQWDVILVDAPPGDGPQRPGRMQSIYEASRLAAPDACVFVHDVLRPAEKWFSNRLLGKPVETIRWLGVFGTKAKRPPR